MSLFKHYFPTNEFDPLPEDLLLYQKERSELTKKDPLYKTKIDKLQLEIFDKIIQYLQQSHPDKLETNASYIYWMLDPPSLIVKSFLSITNRKLKPLEIRICWICPGCQTEVIGISISTKGKMREAEQDIEKGINAYKYEINASYYDLKSTFWIEKATCYECLLERRKKIRVIKSHSKSVESKAQHLKSSPYSSYENYLKTDHWLRVRKNAYERAEFRCQLCNKGNCELNTHHRTYERLGREKDSDLIVLCRSCHEKFHDIIPKEGNGKC